MQSSHGSVFAAKFALRINCHNLGKYFFFSAGLSWKIVKDNVE
jgi:hypothetical protein